MYISSVMHFLDAVLALLLLITSSVPVLCSVACVALVYLMDYSLDLPLAPVKVSPPGSVGAAVAPCRFDGGGAAGGFHLQLKPEQGPFAHSEAQPYTGWWNLCGHPLFGPALVSYLLFFFFFPLSLSLFYPSILSLWVIFHLHFSQASTLTHAPGGASPIFLLSSPFFGLLVFLPCPLGLLFCSVPISSFSVPYFSLSIPSSTPVQGSSLPAPSPSGELQPPPPSAFSLFSVSFCLSFSLSLRRLHPWIPTISVCCYLFMFSIVLFYLPMRYRLSFFLTVHTHEYPLFFYQLLPV